MVIADAVGELTLRGFSRPMRAYNVIGLDEARAPGMTEVVETRAAAERPQRGTSAAARFARLQERLGARLERDAAQPARRVDRRRAVGRARRPAHDRGRRSRRSRSASCSSCCCSASRGCSVIYVTGRPVPERIIEYYLSLLPGVIPSHARARLHMVATHDGTPRALAEKLLERPRVLDADPRA